MGEGDRRAAETTPGLVRSPYHGQRLGIKFVVVPRRVYHKFYNIFCNPLLWFLQHNLWNSPYTPNIDRSVYDAWETGYVEMNRAFADAIASKIKDSPEPPIVMLEDYHLYLVGGFLREVFPDLVLQHFVHIPWPSPRYWHLLPHSIRLAIYRGLAANDIVGFQTSLDLQHFLLGCETFLPGAQVDYPDRWVRWNGHKTLGRVYPISIDVNEIRRIASSQQVQDYSKSLLPHLGEKNIVRVDRAEPNKNLIRGFRAFQLLLEQHPELRGTVKFLAFLVPSRTHIKQFQRYMDEVIEVMGQINMAYGGEGSKVIEAFLENNYAQALAGLKIADVLLVNTVVDGMSLVAKEGPMVNTRDGVLVLSETSGAYEQLQKAAIGVSPTDLEGTAQALEVALSMQPEERRSRAQTLTEIIQKEDAWHWLSLQLQDLKAIT